MIFNDGLWGWSFHRILPAIDIFNMFLMHSMTGDPHYSEVRWRFPNVRFRKKSFIIIKLTVR